MRSEYQAHQSLSQAAAHRAQSAAAVTAALAPNPIHYRAREIKRTLGLPRAAGYLRNRGVPPEVAVDVLLRN